MSLQDEINRRQAKRNETINEGLASLDEAADTAQAQSLKKRIDALEAIVRQLLEER